MKPNKLILGGPFLETDNWFMFRILKEASSGFYRYMVMIRNTKTGDIQQVIQDDILFSSAEQAIGLTNLNEFVTALDAGQLTEKSKASCSITLATKEDFPHRRGEIMMVFTMDLKFVFKTATSFSRSVKLGEESMRPNTNGVVCIPVRFFIKIAYKNVRSFLVTKFKFVHVKGVRVSWTANGSI
jgi:hypothetical protein